MPELIEVTPTTRRKVRRYRLNRLEKARVELDLPDRSHWSLDVVEISTEGFAFELNGGRPALSVDARFESVAVQVGDIRMGGSVRIAHVTQESEHDVVCGAQFTPGTDADRRSLASLIARLEQIDRRT